MNGLQGSNSLILFLKFLLPSMIGVSLFMFPISYDGKETILLSLLVDIVRSPFEPYILGIIVSVVNIAAIGSAYYLIKKPNWIHSNPSLYIICHTNLIWFCFRLMGALVGLMVYFQFGPEFIWGQETGFKVFTEIGATIFFIICVACLLMPFLTDFGLMEFVGTLVRKPFAVIFTLPGRAAIDATTSFITSSNVGLILSISQYEKGFYSAREACGIAVNFSVVSISFSLLIARVSGLDHIFFTWYLTVIFACILCAILTVRLPPLSRISNDYYPPIGKQIHEENDHRSLFKRSLKDAMGRAALAPNPKTFILNGWYNAIGVVFGVLGPSMAIGTTTLILLIYTPVFNILSTPILLILQLIELPEAKTAAPGFIIGFLDQFMPALVASNIKSDLTRFILAGLGISQLIYMSEVGLVILRSSLPLRFSQLVMIFILRTIITFPIFLIAGLLLL